MTTELPFVSVVMPTRDRPDLMRHSVTSLLQQDYPLDRFEIIVVDDSKRATRSNLPQAENLRYLPNASQGVNAARNTGVQAAKGDPICFVDDDIEAPKDWLSNLVAAALERPEIGCLGGRLRLRLEGPAPRRCPSCAARPLASSLDLEPGAEPEWVWSANMAVWKKALDAAGPFDPGLQPGGDETEWELRLKSAGGRVGYAHEAWLWHRRTRDDLRLRRLAAARFVRGMNNILAAKQMGDALPNPYKQVAGDLWHAARFRCWGGILFFFEHLGDEVGRLRYVLRRSRKTATA